MNMISLRTDIHNDEEHYDCHDPARCSCECLTCKRIWFDVGRPSNPDIKCPNGHSIGICGTLVCNKKDGLKSNPN